jgi:hypothetical protein
MIRLEGSLSLILDHRDKAYAKTAAVAAKWLASVEANENGAKADIALECRPLGS